MVDVVHDDIAVREATPGDLAAVLTIDHEPDRAADVSEAVTTGRCQVAEVDGEVVAFSVRGEFFGHDFLELLVVTAERRRQGIGAALVEAWAAGARTAKLFTSTNASNEPMRALCSRLGFVAAGTLDHLDEGDPEVVYFRPVDRPRPTPSPLS
jgi:GNAT superfamily N-acetyltransferase